MISWLLKAGRRKILVWAGLLTVLVTLMDWITGNEVSLAAFYIVPVMLGSAVLRPIQVAAFAILCSYLRSWYDVPGSPTELALRFLFAAVAYFVSGLFVGGVIRNREQAVQHLEHIKREQRLRREAEEELRVLAESSPAAILTVAGEGKVLSANNAAKRLLLVPESSFLAGRNILDHFPFLADALRFDAGSLGLQTAVKCQGRRCNGELFQAQMWFSSYLVPEGKRLAAIIVDSSEELRDREEESLRQLQAGNQIAASAIAHEIRNSSEAMVMLCQDLRERNSLAQDSALRGLESLVNGLESIASLDLQAQSREVEQVALRDVLDDLRIVVEPAWREIDGVVRWQLPQHLPTVWAEPHGLLQAFLNLVQNSHRAVQDASHRELNVSVHSSDHKVEVRFTDSGPGVAAPNELFRPFQRGASGSGLGLYISRFIVRSYGGELRFEPSTNGSCFVVELDTA